MPLQRQTFIENVLIEKGARILQHPEARGPKFSIFAVCDDDEGRKWHGEVVLGGYPILESGSVDSDTKAAQEAERLLAQKFLEVFGPKA